MVNYHDIIKRYFDVWNSGDLVAFDSLVTPDYINHSPAFPVQPGPEDLKKIVVP